MKHVSAPKTAPAAGSGNSRQAAKLGTSQWRCALVALAVAGCLAANIAPAKPRTYHGVASYYGVDFAHQKTASGERYNPNALTAASRTLPLGAHVKVTNLDNGRSVVVRINDRGPYAEHRIIDLSRRAARQLRMIDDGTARVKLRVLAR